MALLWHCLWHCSDTTYDTVYGTVLAWFRHCPGLVPALFWHYSWHCPAKRVIMAIMATNKEAKRGAGAGLRLKVLRGAGAGCRY